MSNLSPASKINGANNSFLAYLNLNLPSLITAELPEEEPVWYCLIVVDPLLYKYIVLLRAK